MRSDGEGGDFYASHPHHHDIDGRGIRSWAQARRLLKRTDEGASRQPQLSESELREMQEAVRKLSEKGEAGEATVGEWTIR